MKSKISFFNSAVLKKDITRFFPLWILYALGALLTVLLLRESSPRILASHILQLLPAMAILNFGYGFLSASVLFGDLFRPRMCNALHAFPLSRERWFLSHLTAGLLFSLIPNLLTAGLLAAQTEAYWLSALLWLGIMMLQYLFFFGVAVFSAMCAGSRLGMTAVYAGIQFLSALVFLFISTLYAPLLRGIAVEFGDYSFFCPLWKLSSLTFATLQWDKASASGYLSVNTGALVYVSAAAVIGLLFLTAALLLYRRRKLECAGDLIAVRPLRPIFLSVFALLSGVFFFLVAQLFNGSKYLFLIIGFSVGFFAGKMLLERSVKIFVPKVLLQFGCFAVAVALSLILTAADIFGIAGYVPPVSQIASVQLSDGDVFADDPSYAFQEKTDLLLVQQLHQALLAEQPDTAPIGRHIQITYRLKNGMTLRRYYNAQGQTGLTQIQQLYSKWQYVFRTDDWDALFSQYHPEVYSPDIPAELMAGFLHAIKQDCLAGTAVQDRSYHRHTGCCKTYIPVTITYRLDALYRIHFLQLDLYGCCSNAIAFLESHEIQYEAWSNGIDLNDIDLDKAHVYHDISSFS